MTNSKNKLILKGSREYAFAMLFSQEFNEDTLDSMPEDELNVEWDPKKVEYIVNGVKTYQKELDKEISKYLVKWKLERLDKVDLMILRIALFEILFSKDTLHYKIIINEAIEIAKKYGSDKSYKFINGLLDRYIKKENINE